MKFRVRQEGAYRVRTELNLHVPVYLHGKRRHVHRILFEIRGQTVVVLRVRHSAQDFLGPEEI